MNRKKKLLFCLQLLGHPRDSKRISMLQSFGYDVNGIGFERAYHNGRLPSCPVTILGKISNRDYLRRFFIFLFSIARIRRFASDYDLIYCSGQDMSYLAFISCLGLNIPLVAEVGDLTPLQTSSHIISRIFRFVDSLFCSQLSLLVVISEGFRDIYYKTWLKCDVPVIVLENKILESDFTTLSDSNSSFPKPLRVDSSVIRIGYFGLLRDNWSINVLYQLATQYPLKYQIYLAGLPQLNFDLLSRIDSCPNMQYLGQYKSPADLPLLYSSVDIVWACYPPIDIDNWNLRWGRPNRFYESCFFGIPCFARDGCLFAGDVSKFSLGYVISSSDADFVVQELSELTKDQIQAFAHSTRNLPRSFYTYGDEVQLLKSSLHLLLD